jgi:hypothetical protein
MYLKHLVKTQGFQNVVSKKLFREIHAFWLARCQPGGAVGD